MSKPTFFESADPSILSPERQEQLQRFAEEFVPKAKALGFKADNVVEIMLRMNDEDRKHILGRTSTVFDDSKYGFDLLALLQDDGVELGQDISAYYGDDLADWREDVERGGLHAAHFRIGLPNTIDCARAAIRMCHSSTHTALDSYITDLNPAHFSVFSLDAEEDAAWLDDAYKGHPGSTFRTVAKAFWMLDDESKWSTTGFKRVVREMAQNFAEQGAGKARLSLPLLYGRLANRVLPIIYNMGFRMVAANQPVGRVIDKVKEMTEYALVQIVGRIEHPGIQRQVLINFLSAFPESLPLIDFKPHELFGVPLDPNITHDADRNTAYEIFGGPVTAFSQMSNGSWIRSSAVRFLANHGYRYDLDFAGMIPSVYFLQKIPEVFEGVCHPSPLIQNKGADWLFELSGGFIQEAHNKNWLGRLFNAESIPHYSDVELLAVIEACIANKFTARLSTVFEQRPQLKIPVLECMASHGQANLAFLDSFGFDRDELQHLGTRASGELIDRQMSRDLGL